MNTYCFIYELNGSTFSDPNRESWIMAMPKGSYSHPQYGKLEFDDNFLSGVCDGVINNIRGQQLDIDYDHKANSGEAAGWIKSAEVRPEGLFILVEWTAKAYDMIKNNEYKYFSPEYMDEWTHPVTNVTYKNVLCGGGITNRPFLKGISPLNLSELEIVNEEKEGGGMTPEEFGELLKILKLQPGTTVEQIFDMLNKIMEDMDKDKDKEKDKGDGGQADANKPPAMGNEYRQYSENPQMIALKEMLDAQANELHEARVNNVIAKFSDGSRGTTLGNPAIEAIKSLLNTNKSKEFSEQISTVIDSLLSSGGIVTLGELGKASINDANVTSSTKLNERIDALVNKGMSYADAALQAVDEMPQDYLESLGGK